MYCCGECGSQAVVTDDGVKRSCEHTSAVLASASASLLGVGGVSS